MPDHWITTIIHGIFSSHDQEIESHNLYNNCRQSWSTGVCMWLSSIEYPERIQWKRSSDLYCILYNEVREKGINRALIVSFYWYAISLVTSMRNLTTSRSFFAQTSVDFYVFRFISIPHSPAALKISSFWMTNLSNSQCSVVCLFSLLSYIIQHKQVCHIWW